MHHYLLLSSQNEAENIIAEFPGWKQKIAAITFAPPFYVHHLYLEPLEFPQAVAWLQRNLGPAVARAIRRSDKQIRIVFLDMDATAIVEESLDMVAEKLGLGDEVAAVTDRAMRGEIEFGDALKTRMHLLAGIPRQTLHEVAQTLTIQPGLREFIRELKSRCIPTYILSGGFEPFSTYVAAELQCTGYRCNRFVFADDKLTGRVEAPFFDGHAKEQSVRELCFQHQIDVADALAVGDGANDRLMLRLAGLPIGFRAKPVLYGTLHGNIGRSADFGFLQHFLFAEPGTANDAAKKPEDEV